MLALILFISIIIAGSFYIYLSKTIGKEIIKQKREGQKNEFIKNYESNQINVLKSQVDFLKRKVSTLERSIFYLTSNEYKDARELWIYGSYGYKHSSHEDNILTSRMNPESGVVRIIQTSKHKSESGSKWKPNMDIDPLYNFKEGSGIEELEIL